MTRFITTFFFVGLLPRAPGTWGSLAALPIAYLLHMWGGFWLLAAATATLFLIGWWATSRETAGKENHDPGEIVVDEVVGQWITLLPISAAVSCTMEGQACVPLALVLLAFALFRLYDIRKPSLVGSADRLHTPLGVMLDDVAAGAMAAAMLAGLAALISIFL